MASVVSSVPPARRQYTSTLGISASPVRTRAFQVACIIALSLLIAGCHDHRSANSKLKNDFVITTSTPGCSFLVRGDESGGSILLGPTISHWEQRGHFVVGEVTQHNHSSPDLTTTKDDIGFFILDLDSCQLTKGLSRADYDQRLLTLIGAK